MNKKVIAIFLLLCLLPAYLIYQVLISYLSLQRLNTDLRDYTLQWSKGEQVDQKTISNIQQNLQKINNKLNKIDLPILKPVQDMVTAATILSHDRHRYIVMLQNSDELRATGGFFGSYFILEIDQGQLAKLQIKDIYVIDGQFTGFREAPRGLNEYLSSGKGLRLPDSNWWADFPTSAKTVLSFFNEIESEQYDGVIAINLPLLEKLLQMTGSIYLPDYKTEVNADNFAQLARADRSDFFPGSQEKVNFLNHFFKHLQLKTVAVAQDRPLDLFKLLQQAILSKDLQLYSDQQAMQALIFTYKLDGRLHNPTKGRFYAPIESNVGINKANRQVDRQFALNIGQDNDQFQITWRNNFDQHYINYYRLYLRPDSQVTEVMINQAKTAFQQQIIQNEQGEEFLEIAFLISVLSQQSAQVVINIHHGNQLSSPLIYLRHQSGLAESQFTLTHDGKNSNFVFAADQIVDLSLLE